MQISRMQQQQQQQVGLLSAAVSNGRGRFSHAERSARLESADTGTVRSGVTTSSLLCTRMWQTVTLLLFITSAFLPITHADKAALFPFGPAQGDRETEKYIGWTTTLNTMFPINFFGYRFNYTMVSNDGHVAFSQKPQISTWPLELPNPRWPNEPDHAFIAPFYAESDFRDREPISHVWYRAVQWKDLDQVGPGEDIATVDRDNKLILHIVEEVKWAINGATDFVGTGLVIVTWDNVTFSGVNLMEFLDGKPVHKPESRIPRNTYQLMIITDGVRTYCMFNYGNTEWVANPKYGADVNTGLNGLAAMAGFNAGNGTGWWPNDPYSGMQEMANLWVDTNCYFPGRFVFRIDEIIMPGGCTNLTEGPLVFSPATGNMMGGEAVNVSGPCFLNPDKDNIKCRFQEIEVKGHFVNHSRARCIAPMFDFPGWVRLEVSRDNGKTYRFRGNYYVGMTV